jgi:hypothetical protein
MCTFAHSSWEMGKKLQRKKMKNRVVATLRKQKMKIHGASKGISASLMDSNLEVLRKLGAL